MQHQCDFTCEEKLQTWISCLCTSVPGKAVKIPNRAFLEAQSFLSNSFLHHSLGEEGKKGNASNKRYLRGRYILVGSIYVLRNHSNTGLLACNTWIDMRSIILNTVQAYQPQGIRYWAGSILIMLLFNNWKNITNNEIQHQNCSLPTTDLVGNSKVCINTMKSNDSSFIAESNTVFFWEKESLAPWELLQLNCFWVTLVVAQCLSLGAYLPFISSWGCTC